MIPLDVLLYASFSDTPTGGSPAGVVLDATGLSAEQMQSIATDVGAPATCFVTAVDASSVDVRFFSTITEYGTCGHGTIALATALVDTGAISLPEKGLDLALRTPAGLARVRVRTTRVGRPEVMLALDTARFESVDLDLDLDELVGALGIGTEDLGPTPIEQSPSDFMHLIVPVGSLSAIQRINPDFNRLEALCQYHGIETVAPFTTETINPWASVHCRDFCPAVGTDEAAATGTTNRAISAYLVRHGLAGLNTDGAHTVLAEQGHEMGRPSTVRTALVIEDGAVTSIQVGGGATLMSKSSRSS